MTFSNSLELFPERVVCVSVHQYKTLNTTSYISHHKKFKDVSKVFHDSNAVGVWNLKKIKK